MRDRKFSGRGGWGAWVILGGDRSSRHGCSHRGGRCTYTLGFRAFRHLLHQLLSIRRAGVWDGKAHRCVFWLVGVSSCADLTRLRRQIGSTRRRGRSAPVPGVIFRERKGSGRKKGSGPRPEKKVRPMLFGLLGLRDLVALVLPLRWRLGASQEATSVE